ncbi:MAG TPA: GNAT family N-acetyltransferase [Hyphomicrobiaceae bacterium]
MLYHDRPGTAYDAAFWQALHALQDRIWPQMSARIEAARKFGVHWEAQTTPFAWVEQERVLAHVGVIAHPLRLMGGDYVVAGIHAVCTDPEMRGRGLGRRCMEAALAWIDKRFDLAKLSTAIPGYYARWSFSLVPTHRFVAHRAGGGGPARPATLADSARIRTLLLARTPTSEVYATRDPGWLPITNLALQGRLPGGMLVVPQRDFLIVARQQGQVLHLDDIIGPELPALEEVLLAIPFRFERVIYGFTPDRLDQSARPEPIPVTEAVMQIRGAWPTLPPFAVSPVWEH